MQTRFKYKIVQSKWQWIAYIPLLFTLLTFSACKKDQITDAPISMWDAPAWFPEMDIPLNNQFTKKRWDLGKKLFYENRLSIDSSISCASCHDPKLSFAVNEALSDGVYGRPGVRNASMLANIGYAPHFLREGGVPTLEMQVLVPIQEHNEFDNNILTIADELSLDEEYQNLALQAYDTTFSPWVLTRALGVFQRTLISGNSPYDQFEFKGDTGAFNDDELAGYELFISNRLKCSECHSGVFFTDFEFANNGLKEVYEDDGRFRLTELEEDRAVFKIPSLRNIELTGPYLHDGSVETLEEIIDLYSSGGFSHPNKSPLLSAPINLSDQEKAQLLAFLRSLSDHSFVNDERWEE